MSDQERSRHRGNQSECWLIGGGEMGDLVRAKDWSHTPLGPIESWPQSLRTALGILLNSRYPMFVFWGPERVKIYNDAYRPITGGKHPWALGRPGAEVWPEIWDTIGPMVDEVVQRGQSTWYEDLRLFMHRRGFPEEVYFTFSYSPIRDERGGIGGLFCACTETTAKVLSERRMKTLHDLAAESADVRTSEEICRRAMAVLRGNEEDLPFALLYRRADAGDVMRLAGSIGLETGTLYSPLKVAADGAEGPWPLRRIAETGQPERIEGLMWEDGQPPPHPWPEPPSSAYLVPLIDRADGRCVGLVVLGISARLMWDQEYRGFLDLTAAQIAASLNNASASEAERKRAEALAELDRAKTAFFSNISHEFRTPLTLMLGPLEDALAHAHGILPPGAAQDLETSHRNALRLLKLVNTMLDFSRIEAGRIQASYHPTDLASLTAELASNFRSACEKAGLRLVIDCPPLSEPVYVDRDMWEKIVLNLISNAFKFTLDGEIEVSLKEVGSGRWVVDSDEREGKSDGIMLRVRDTGVGIPSDELPRMFERFHRVERSRGRTHEGTGIGLALVQELVKLHGGTVQVDSIFGKGSAFTVTIPFGTAHLPEDRINAGRTLASTATGAAPFVEEALRWMPENSLSGLSGLSRVPGDQTDRIDKADFGTIRPRVLVVEDNADMREYLRRLLNRNYEVEAVADGKVALQRIQADLPDLVLSDVMMPRLDGFGLLRALRDDPATKTIPVILLSARAGEESRVEGLGQGADDYLTKPFSARELLARVEAHIRLQRVRREAEARLRSLAGRLESLVKERTQELEQSRERLRALATELNLAEQRERRRLATELHDHLQQMLVLGKLKLGQGKRLANVEPTAVKLIKETDEVLSDALTYTRTMVAELSPPVLREFGLSAGLKWLGEYMKKREHRVAVVVPDSGDLKLPDDQVILLFQSVRELLINSSKHAETSEAKVTMEQRDGNLFITVSDEGKGFDLAAAPPAEVPSGGLSSKYGLYSIQERMLALGGSFDIRSAPGQGTTAMLSLPLSGRADDARVMSADPPEVRPSVRLDEPARRAPKARQPVKRKGVKTVQVLLVDDHEMIRQGLRMVLESYNDVTIVGEAVNGEEALAAVEKLRPDVVIMDINMPRMNGIEATGRIKHRYPETAVIGLSVNMREADRQAMRQAGAVHLMTKESAVEQLYDAIQEAMKNREPAG